ncbi:MAG: thiol-disulfide oxidoreductase DCC family protein [Steroidobacter sp.]
MGRVKVYYNSACPVCNAGIRDQRRRMEACSAAIDWIDIHRDPQRVADIGASQEFVRERLHLLDENGDVQVGSDAFHALWKRTPGQRHLARFIDLPVIRTAVRWTYNAFAALLYSWNRANRRW